MEEKSSPNPPKMEPDDPCCVSGTDEETMALKKKRSRRVSFADREITSVHIFNRDEDFETPPEDDSAKNHRAFDNAIGGANDEILGFFRDLEDSDDSKEISPMGYNEEEEEEEEEIVDARKSFLRPIESPSPGSSNFGSATSNDEDNFFGPVSASFIRPGRLSDSVASDDNHDVTMDSTAFSMHYQSLAKSESGGDVKTPTNVRLAFEEKTPSHTATPADGGSFMVLSKDKMLHSEDPLPVDKVSGGRDSNAMSLVGESGCSYDYGRLPPEVEALLAEGSKALHAAAFSASTHPKTLSKSEVSKLDGNGSNYMDQMDIRDKRIGNDNTLVNEADGFFVTINNCSSGRDEDLTAKAPIDSQTPDDSNKKQAPNGMRKRLYDEDLAAETPTDHKTPDHLNKKQDLNGMRKVNNDQNKPVIETNTVDVEFTSFKGVAPTDMHHKVTQLDSFTQHTSEKYSNDVQVDSPLVGRDKVIDQDSDQKQESPLVGSISLLSSKRSQLFLDTAKSNRPSCYITPSPKRPVSLLDKENIKTGGIAFSADKSNSRFKIFEPSPLASSLKEGIEKSRLRLSEFISSATSSFSTGLELNSYYIRRKNVDAPISNFENDFSSTDIKGKHKKETTYSHVDDAGTRKNNAGLRKIEGTISLPGHGGPPMHVSAHDLSKERSNLTLPKIISPPPFYGSQNKMSKHVLMSEKSVEGMFVISGSDPPLMDNKLEDRTNTETNSMPNNFNSPAVKRLDQKSSSAEYRGSICEDLNQQAQNDDLFSVGLGQKRNTVGSLTDHNGPTSLSERLKSGFDERRVHSRSPLLQNKQIHLPSSDESETLLENFRTFSGEKNILGAMPPIHNEEEPPNAGKASPRNDNTSINDSSPKSLFENEVTQSPIAEGLTQNSLMKEQWNASNAHNAQPLVGEVVISLTSKLGGCAKVDDHLGVDYTQKGIEKSSGQKRRIEEPFVGDADHAEVSRIKKSRQIQQSQGSDLEFMLECSNESDDGSAISRGDAGLKHWSNILPKLSADTKDLFSPLVYKLHIGAVGLLQDFLAHLQKIMMYELLCSQIQSQRMFDPSSNIRQVRLCETRLLLNKLVFAKARMHIMSVRREKLLKRHQQLNSAIQGFQTLKSNNALCLSASGKTVNAAVADLCMVNFGSKNEVSREKVIAMRHEYEILDRKIKNLTKYFHSYCKMKGEPSCSEIVVLLNNHLQKRNSCRFIKEHLQIWEVDDLGSKNGQLNVVLNYRGLFCQRFKVTAVPAPSVFVLNELDVRGIMKHFPNIDACTAFTHGLKAETSKKYFGSRMLAQETQMTTSRLHNLLDVVEEVLLARVEIKNLVDASFHSSSAENLDLQLCFVCFNGGGLVKVTLDITCLKWGIYPSEIIPCLIQESTGAQKFHPGSQSAAIKAAVDGLTAGYPRIIRLCRCVSQVVQSLST